MILEFSGDKNETLPFATRSPLGTHTVSARTKHPVPRAKGAVNTVGLVQCIIAEKTVADCKTAVTDAIGVATATNARTVEVQARGIATVSFASASPSAGWYACSTKLTAGSHNIVVQSGRCAAGKQVGILTRGGTSITEAPVLLQFK